jgi:hypothetical protein
MINKKRGSAVGVLLLAVLGVVIIAVAVLNTSSTGDVSKRVVYEAESVTGTLTITSEPSDAEVIINGDYAGQTPYFMEDIPSNNGVDIVIRKAGYKNYERSMTIERAKDKELHVRLRER